MSIKTFKTYLTEESSPAEEFLSTFRKVINDEITATVLYLRLANELDGAGNDYFRDQMEEHAEDEYGHFKDLLEIAANRGISFSVNFTPDANKPIDITNSKELIDLTQELETIAIEDYRKLATICGELKEYDLQRTFKEILSDEAEHFDDVSVITGETRPIM